MKSSRVLTVYLTLAALLLGNAAGWVHVGCSAHHPGCCAVESSVAAATPADTTQADDHGGHGVHGGHGCCHHDHEDACQTDGRSDESDSEQPAKQHDSERCSICHSFFASRHVALLADVVPCVEKLAVCGDVVVVADGFAANDLSRSQTVRGPPSV